MSRKEMIELLIEDRIWEWVYAGDHEGLREMLTTGFVGFDNYTDKKLKKTLSEFDYFRIKELKEMVETNKRKAEMDKFENKFFTKD